MTTGAAFTDLRMQEFLDSVSTLSLNRDHREWYNVEVAAAIDGCNIQGHEVDNATGSALLFLRKSVVLCVPDKGHIAHYPRNMIHCFLDDFRRNGQKKDGMVMRAELFSISPCEEQLGWELKCRSEHEVPTIQASVSRWLRWLNA